MLNSFKKFTGFFTVGAMLLGLAPQVQAADLYANELVSYSQVDLLSPQNALGAPDQQYADFRDEETYLKLDMGAGEEGRDGLTLFLVPLNYGATAVVTFYSADGVSLGSANTILSPGATEWTAAYLGTEPFRYVKIESPDTEQWRLDAVQASAINTPVIEDEAEDVVEPEAEEEDLSLASNTLIKLADNDAVYVLGEDGKRHPFPNEITFFSWGYSFDDIVILDSETMASFMIGGSVTMKPNTYLVKAQSVPKVYAVGPNHTLHWLFTEEIAAEIYGSSWANTVVDISDAFWSAYTEGTIINSPDDIEGWEVETQAY